MKVLVLNGPNLDLLGTREPDTYGSTTLAELTDSLDAVAPELGLTLRHAQSNSESDLLAEVRVAMGDGTEGIVINAAGFTHTSVVLRDALIASQLPFIEVHISNVHARESFRHTSLLADVSSGVITGCGIVGYELALRALTGRIGAR